MTVEEILIDFGTKLKEDVQKNLQEKQKEKASKHGSNYNPNSNLVNSVKFFINEKNGALVFELRMADYYDWVDRGRKSGSVSKEGQKSISDWVKKKGLKAVDIIQGMRDKQRAKNPPKRISTRKPKKLTYEVARKQLTYLVSRKVNMYGFRGNYFYSEIILDGRLEKLKEDISKATKEQINIVLE